MANPADPITSLPGRAAAENAIRELARSGKNVLTALFVVDRLASINASHGRDAGDEVLLAVARTIANELSDASLYRWSGPVILAIFRPKADLLVAESRARKIAGLPTEKGIVTPEGVQIIKVTCSLRLQRISPDLSPDSIFHSFDASIATQ